MLDRAGDVQRWGVFSCLSDRRQTNSVRSANGMHQYCLEAMSTAELSVTVAQTEVTPYAQEINNGTCRLRRREVYLKLKLPSTWYAKS